MSMNFAEWFDLQETLALAGNYKGSLFQRLVAATYRIAPTMMPEAIPGYKDLMEKMNRQNQFMQSKFTFNPTSGDPYRSMKHLKSSIDKQRAAGIKKPVMNVYAEPPGPEGQPADQGHPVMPNDVNVMVRGVHDAIAHLAGNHPFTARGEYGAYNRHLKTLCNRDQAKGGNCPAAQVLFSEIVGQTSHFYVYGDYPAQKAIIMKDFDHYNVGLLAPSSPLNRHFVVKNKQMVPRMDFNWDNFAKEFPELARELRNQEGFEKKASAPRVQLQSIPGTSQPQTQIA